MANAASEGAAISEQTDFIKNIVISDGKAQAGIRNPLIAKVLGTIKAETGQDLKYELPKLGYEYGQLEPTICEEIMRIHHSKVRASGVILC